MRSIDVIVMPWYLTRSVVLQRCQWHMSWYRNAMTWRCDRSKVWSLPTEWSLTANASFWLIAIHNTNMCMWALSHTYTCVIAYTHTDIQTYRPKVYIWKQHNSHALVSTLSTFSFFAPFIPLFIPKIATFHSISIWQCVLCLCVCVYVHAFSKSAICSLTWCDCACVFLCLFVVCVFVCVCMFPLSVLCVSVSVSVSACMHLH